MANYHNTQVFIDDRRYNLKYSIVKSIEEYVESVNMYNGGSSSVIRETKKNTYERKKSDLKKLLNFLETKNYDIKYTYNKDTLKKDFIIKLPRVITKYENYHLEFEKSIKIC